MDSANPSPSTPGPPIAKKYAHTFSFMQGVPTDQKKQMMVLK
jgi:hypothetical protein